MERIDNLPENALEQELARLELDAVELKNRQLVSGGNVRFYMSDSGNTYDWQGALPAGGQFPGAGAKIFRVTATAQNMDNLFADLILEIYDGSGVLWTGGRFLAALVANTQPQFYRVQYEEPANIADSNKRKWVIGVTGLAGDAAKLKVYVVASDACTLSFEVIN